MNTRLASATALRDPARWAPLAVAVAALLLVLAAVRLAWLLIAGPTLPVVEGAPASAPATTRQAQPAGSIAQWHLFGNAAPLQPLHRDAPETSLALFLRGTLNADDPDRGIAIIADSEGNERAYRVGEAVPGGATLQSVEAGRVLLSRDGGTEALSLPRAGESSATDAPASGATAARGAAATRASRGGASLPGAAPTTPFVNPAISVGGPNLETARAALRPDLERLAREVSAIPVMENGRMVGVRLSAGRESGLLERAGLRPDDVVTHINGTPLDGPHRMPQLTRELQNASSAQITVRRDGREMRLTVSPDSL